MALLLFCPAACVVFAIGAVWFCMSRSLLRAALCVLGVVVCGYLSLLAQADITHADARHTREQAESICDDKPEYHGCDAIFAARQRRADAQRQTDQEAAARHAADDQAFITSYLKGKQQ